MKNPSQNKKINTRGYLELAYRYLSYKPRTRHEMTVYLNKKGAKASQIETIINDLTTNNFLNDHDYADWFIQNRIKFKPKSKFALAWELKQKGISADISDPLLSGASDIQLARKAVEPKLSLWQRLDDDVLKKKILNYLSYRGFSYSDSSTVFQQIIKEIEEP